MRMLAAFVGYATFSMYPLAASGAADEGACAQGCADDEHQAATTLGAPGRSMLQVTKTGKASPRKPQAKIGTRFMSLTFPMAANASNLIQQQEEHEFCFNVPADYQEATVDDFGVEHLHPVNVSIANGQEVLFATEEQDQHIKGTTACCKGTTVEAGEMIMTTCDQIGVSLSQIPETIIDVNVARTDKEGVAEAAQEIAQFAREIQTSSVFLFEDQHILNEVELSLGKVRDVTLSMKEVKTASSLSSRRRRRWWQVLYAWR